MIRELCELNSAGVEEFQKLIDAERQKVKPFQPALVSENFFASVKSLISRPTLIQPVDDADGIDDAIVFESSYDFGKYLHQTLPGEISTTQYSNIGLWAWISAVYLLQLLKPSSRSNTHDLRSAYRYIPISPSHINYKFRYYRHLAFISFWLHQQLGENAARLFLSRPMYQTSDDIEDLYTSHRDFLTSPALLEVSVEMYIDPKRGSLKRNAWKKDFPGSARRLVTKVMKQLEMNFDMHSMTKDQVYDLLPAEFDAWRSS